MERDKKVALQRICRVKGVRGWKEIYSKRDNIQKGCSRLYRTCGEHRIPCRRGTWHMDQRGLWDGSCKGIDDYLFSCRQKEGAA